MSASLLSTPAAHGCTSMRATAYPGEDPMTLPPPEAIMPLYLYLMGPDSHEVNGQTLNAQD